MLQDERREVAGGHRVEDIHHGILVGLPLWVCATAEVAERHVGDVPVDGSDTLDVLVVADGGAVVAGAPLHLDGVEDRLAAGLAGHSRQESEAVERRRRVHLDGRTTCSYAVWRWPPR